LEIALTVGQVSKPAFLFKVSKPAFLFREQVLDLLPPIGG